MRRRPRIAAHLNALLGVMHALPLAYNKDMQEDKEHLFDTVDTLNLCLEAATGMLRTAEFDRERLAGGRCGRVRSPPPTSRTCWYAAEFRSGSHMRSSAGSSATR